MGYNILLIYCSVLLIVVSVQGDDCVDKANVCFNNITIPTADLTYEAIGIPLYAPQTWNDYCQQLSNHGVLKCLRQALTSSSCALVSRSEAKVLDVIDTTEFKCSKEALDVYAANWDCFSNEKFESDWEKCHKSYIHVTDVIQAALLNPIGPDQFRQLLQQFCSAFQTYLYCVYSSATVHCGQAMGKFMYRFESEPVKHNLMSLGCREPADISNLTLCDPQTARLCISTTDVDIKVLATGGNIEAMCSEIGKVHSNFTKCYTQNTGYCASTEKLELDMRMDEVVTAITEVKELCNSPVLPSEADCDYQNLRDCETTLLKALDMEIEKLCVSRKEFIANYSSCVDADIDTCPNVTQNYYRTLEKRIHDLWWNKQSNYSCLLTELCVIEFLEKQEEFLGCLRSNIARESFEKICSDYQRTFACIDRYIGECEAVVYILKEEGILDDLMETNSFYDCNVTFRGNPITPDQDACNYREVLQCYNQFFGLIGVRSGRILEDLPNLSTLFLNTVRTKPTFCRDMNVVGLRSCLDNKLLQCKDFTESKLGHEINSQTYQQVIYDNNKILSYDIVQDVEYLCSSGCSNISNMLKAVDKCSLADISFSSIKDSISFYKYTSTYFNIEKMRKNCGLLRSYTTCVITSGGTCPFVRHHYLDYHKLFYPEVTQQELLNHCSITLTSACDKSFDHCISPTIDNVYAPELAYSKDSNLTAFKSKLETSIIANQDSVCRSLWNFDGTKRSDCINQMASGCVYGSVYTDHYMDWVVTIERAIDSMCITECNGIMGRYTDVSRKCERPQKLHGSLEEIIQAIKNGWLTGDKYDSYCSQLEAISDCISNNSGDCPYLQQYAKSNFLNLETSEALASCNKRTSKQASSTHAPQTTGAIGIKGHLSTILIAVLILMCC